MKTANREPGKGVFDLVEEPVHLLRAAPRAFGTPVYAVGTLPFSSWPSSIFGPT